MVLQQDPRDDGRDESGQGGQVDTARRDPSAMHVRFVNVNLGVAVVAARNFVVALDEVLGGVRNDVKAHEEKKDGHGEAGKDLGSF